MDIEAGQEGGLAERVGQDGRSGLGGLCLIGRSMPDQPVDPHSWVAVCTETVATAGKSSVSGNMYTLRPGLYICGGSMGGAMGYLGSSYLMYASMECTTG